MVFLPLLSCVPNSLQVNTMYALMTSLPGRQNLHKAVLPFLTSFAACRLGKGIWGYTRLTSVGGVSAGQDQDRSAPSRLL